MKNRLALALMLVLGLFLGFALAQESDKEDDMDHGHEMNQEMDHSQHDDMAEDGSGMTNLNVVTVGEHTVTLEPLISPDGMLTLGLKIEPATDATLTLSAVSPAGEARVLEPAPVMVMRKDGDAKEGHEDHGDGEMSDNDMDESHDGEPHDENEMSDVDHSEHNMDTTVMTTLNLPVGEVTEGIWRFDGTLGSAQVSFPLSVYKASTNHTDVYLALAPSPTLSNRALSEAFVYAFRNGEAVHGGMTVGRAMAGMRHSTDEERLSLVHNHFNDVYNDSAGFKPMANQSPLSFAMAGTWNVEVMLMGETKERIAFNVEVLDE